MPRSIPIRKPRFDFSDVPRHWIRDDGQFTHAINGLCALFPDGEMFFVRSVRHFEDQVDIDPERLRGFYGQEAQHGSAHRAQFKMLEDQGYDIDTWLTWYRKHAYNSGLEDVIPPEVQLATTAALEHFTAALAEVAMDPEDVVEDLHPTMRYLLRWHAAEEIEHKSVAFDVLQQVDPRLRIRWVGFALATYSLLLYGTSAAAHLGRQDGIRGCRRRLLRELAARPKIARTALRFCRRAFHPDDDDNYHLAEQFFARQDAA